MATVVATTGKTIIRDKVDAGTFYGAWGTGPGTAAVGDTTLFTEDSAGSPAYARIAVTNSKPASDKNQFVWSITSNGSKTITNAGVFDALTVGNLFVKGDFSGIALALNDVIQFTVQVQYT